MSIYYGNMKQVVMPAPPVTTPVLELQQGKSVEVDAFRVAKSGDTPRQATRVALQWDPEALAVVFTCADTDIVAQQTGNGNLKLWKDDSVYVWLDPGHTHDTKHTLMIQLSAGGVLCIQRNGAVTSIAQLAGEATRCNGGWQATLCIPWQGLGVDAPGPGAVWGVNLARMDQPGVYDYNTMELSTLAGRPGDKTPDPHTWGHILFTGADADARTARQTMEQAHAVHIDQLGVAYYRELVRAKGLDEELDTRKGLPANPKASKDACKVLKYLTGLPDRKDKRVLLAQDIWSYQGGLDDGYERFVVRLAEKTGKWLPMLHVSYPDSSVDTEKSGRICADANRHAIAYWKAGGLITFHTNPANPWTGGGSCDQAHRENLANVIKDGTPENQAWIRSLDALSSHLTVLRDAGVVVLWRPLHEMTFTNCYWYDCGATEDRDVFKNLWRHMFRYMIDEKGLDNLLWVYSTSDVGSWNGPAPDSVYPGGDYVDVVGISLYGNSVTVDGGAYEKLTALGKPFAFSEFGPGHHGGAAGMKTDVVDRYDNMTLIRSIREKYPRTIWAAFWHSWTHADMAIVDNPNAEQLFADPWIADRSDVDWKNIEPNQPEKLHGRAL